MRYALKIFVYLLLAFGFICGAAILAVHEQWTYAVLMVIPVVIIFRILYGKLANQQKELDDFVEDVRYRDFTRSYGIKGSDERKRRHKAFNELNVAFRSISGEREMQLHYLQRILEMVDTGILAYEMETGRITWMNESFRQILRIPQVKNMSWLQNRNPELYNALNSLKLGEQRILEVNNGNSTLKMLASLSTFQSDGYTYKLIAFQNVNSTLDEVESVAWKRLLSVMTHEIMNSIAPVSSLANTLNGTLTQLKDEVPQEQQAFFEDLKLGIETIKNRSDGLLSFAQTYRSLNKTIELNVAKVPISKLFENLYRLMSPSLQQKGIELEVIIKDPSIMLNVDRELMEQVLINLIVNATDAVKDKPDPRVILSAELADNGKALLKVLDNGSGIPSNVFDKIFIPFFSTKKKGSGVGLSLCRQIVQQHKGYIQVQTKENEGSIFEIYL